MRNCRFLITKRLIFFTIGLLFITDVIGQRVNSSRNTRVSDEQDFLYAFTEGTKYYLFGNYVQAVTLYKECLKLEPENSTVNFQLSKIFVNAGNTALAREYAKKACKYSKDNVWFLQNLADLFQVEQKYDSAATIIKDLISIKPENANYYFALATLDEKLKQYPEALSNLEQVDKRIGISRESILARYRIYEATGQPDKAIEELKEAGNMDNEEYNINGLIADYYRKQNKADSAQKFYNKIFPAHADDPLVVFSYSEFLLQHNLKDSATHLIENIIVNKDVDNMVKASYFYNLIQNPEDYKIVSPIIDTIAEVYYNAYYDDIRVMSIYADIQIRLKNLTKAEDVLKRIVANDARNYPAVEQLLYVLNVEGKVESLLSYSQDALKNFTDRPLIYLFNGSAKFQKNLYKDAIEVLKKGVDLTDDKELKLEFYSLLAESYQQTGNFELSENAFENALKFDSHNSAILNNYAYYLSLRNKDLGKAQSMSKETIKSEPENATYLDTYAWVLFKARKYKEARKYIDMAMTNDPSADDDIIKHAIDIYIQLKQYDEAGSLLKKILSKGRAEDKNYIAETSKRIEELKK